MSQRGKGFNYSGFSLSKNATTTTGGSSAASSYQKAFIGGGNLSSNKFGGNSKTTARSDPALFMAATMEYGMKARRRQLDEDDALDEEEELEYIPAPGSPSAANDADRDEVDEDDPLDAFMANIEVQAKKDKEICEKHEKEDSKTVKNEKQKLGRTDIEGDDDEESYYKWVEENADKLGPQADDEDDDVEYDEEGNPLPSRKKFIDPLPPLDHSTINYEPFERNFYVEHEQIVALTKDRVDELRKKLDIKVSGLRPPKPVCSFAHFGFDEKLMSVIKKSEYSQPTPIQAQGIPVALSGRDIIGIAKTGSGKTAAYLWPALVHLMEQTELQPGDGPICLIVVPTRELAIQVYNEAKRFGKVYGLKVVCAYGGGSKWEQTKDLQDGAEIVVCTPGRIIDMVKIKATNFQRVTYLVFDEADRMFDLGFEAQVRSIANHVRPDRQCLMFSATFKKRIERLARDVLNDPVKVVQGELGEANEDIQQIVEVFNSGPQKWHWLMENLVSLCSIGKVLIFVTQKLHAEELAANLKSKDFSVGLLHGDMLQHERNEVLHVFRKENMPILVATDVAARGLDIPSIKTVVNYDVARDIDTHVHRIGRTGRAGEKGTAYTLVVTDKDKEFAGHLVRNLESVNQEVPKKLMDLAMQGAWFRKNRFREGKAKKPGIGGRGLGFKERSSGSAGGGSSSSISGFNATPTGIRDMVVNETKSGTDRLSAMKAAFSSTYKSTFQVASAETSWNAHQMEFSDPTPEWKKKAQNLVASSNNRDEFKAPTFVKSEGQDHRETRQHEHSERREDRRDNSGGDRKKRSRWD